MEHRLGLGIALLLATSLGCSKENTVDASTHVEGAIGLQCSDNDDCGTSGVCALGYCRLGCLTDAECPQGALCIGDVPPYGCQLPQDVGCNDADQKCQPGLVCGIDGNCRMPCSTDSQCPRNEHACIAGTCVGRSEAGAEAWFLCTAGQLGCIRSMQGIGKVVGFIVHGSGIMSNAPVDTALPVGASVRCNVTAPGFDLLQPVEICEDVRACELALVWAEGSKPTVPCNLCGVCESDWTCADDGSSCCANDASACL